MYIFVYKSIYISVITNNHFFHYFSCERNKKNQLCSTACCIHIAKKDGAFTPSFHHEMKTLSSQTSTSKIDSNVEAIAQKYPTPKHGLNQHTVDCCKLQSSTAQQMYQVLSLAQPTLSCYALS